MLVAEKRSFEYSYSDILYEQERENKRINKKLEEQKKKRAKLKRRYAYFRTTMGVTLALLTAASMILMLMRYSYINEMKYSIRTIEENIVQLEDDYQLKKVKLEEYTQTTLVETRAIEELNMNYPKPDQKVYLSLPGDIRDLAKETTTEEKTENSGVVTRLFKKLLTVLD